MLLPVRNLNYFRSERFIHDSLEECAADIVEQVRETWKKTFNLDPYALTWPNDDLKGDDGSIIEKAVICALPPAATQGERTEVLRQMVARTKAYGLVLIERRGNEIHVMFETHHGARAWVLPLERHGDVLVCGAPEVHEDGACVGILWRAQRGEG